MHVHNHHNLIFFKLVCNLTSFLVHWILVGLWTEPVVANGNNSNGRRYDIDKECCQGDGKAIGETGFMTTTIEREETGKILIQINIDS